MKKVYNKIRINYKSILSIIIIIVLMFMTIGYSSLKQSLYVSGFATITTPDYSIVIKSINVSSTSDGAYQNATPSYNRTELALYSTLPNTNSNITYTILIKNEGLTSGVLDYTFTSLDNSNVQYKIGGISNGKVLAPGESVNVTIEISYWDNVTSVSNSTVSSLFNFEFTPYNSNYSNNCTLSWDGSSTTQPSTRNIYGVNYYEISNANEFAWYANYINNTSNSANAILTNNICLNSKSLQQLGSNNFTGILDGQNRTISGYYHSRETKAENSTKTIYSGLFKQNSGVIKNLNLSGSISEKTDIVPSSASKTPKIYDYVGGIVSVNDGKIANSSYIGSISGRFEVHTNCYVIYPEQYDYVGGIASVNNGVISGSYNKSLVNVHTENTRNACTYRRTSKIYVGGLVGQNNGYISDSYNNNTLTISAYVFTNGKYYVRAGGVIGDFTSGTVKNSYNSGTITYTKDMYNNISIEEEYAGGFSGTANGTLINTYYLNTCGLSGSNGTSVTANDLVNLNINIGNYYTKDISSINSGYPILKWQ